MKKYLNTNSLEFLGVSEISNINDFNGNNLVITEDVDIELTLAEDEALDVTIFTNGNRLRLSSELGTSIRGGATFPQKTRLRITRGINSEAFAVQSSPSDLTLVDFGGGLEGSQYVFVTAEGTDEENATELQSAYNTAKTMSPSATNRITVICGNGNYDFEDDFVMDTQYIDLVSLDGNRSIIFNGTGTINITANDVFVKGVDVGTKKFTIGNDLNLLKVENCQGGDDSFGGFFSFGGNGLPVGTTSVTASGTFTNCQGGDFSFGGSDASFGGTASGTFTNCQGGDSSFGGNGGTASGTFTNCQGGDNSFGDNGTASGTFTNCEGGFDSFGGFGGTASGTFTDCQGGANSFGGFGGTASGTFTDCQGNESSFSNGGTASGTFTNCEGGFDSFGGVGGTVSGTFTYCQGGGGSFGIHGTLSGKLYYCRLTSGIFETVSEEGITRLCIDGNNDENNQG